MKKACVVMLFLFLMLFQYACGRSDEKSEVESKVKKEVQSMEKKASDEMKNLEEDYKVLKEEKDYKQSLKEEPKPPASAVEGVQSEVDLDEEFNSPPE